MSHQSLPPKISIITINLNNATGLLKTVKSVLNQSYSGYEYLIIDGGSTDKSVQIIQEYAHKVNYWISETDKGIYNAMNKGIKRSTGEYLLFLNSGDFLLNDQVLNNMESFLSTSDLVYGNLLVSHENNLSDHLFPSKLTFKYFLKHSLPHPCTFIKNTLFEKVGLYNEQLKIVADWEFFIKSVCTFNCSYKYIDRTISVIDIAGISRNIENKNLIAKEIENVLNLNFPAFIDDYKSMRNGFTDFYIRMVSKLRVLYKKFKRFNLI